jgi:hypothetical protein
MGIGTFPTGILDTGALRGNKGYLSFVWIISSLYRLSK